MDLNYQGSSGAHSVVDHIFIFLTQANFANGDTAPKSA
jgi:hypothetical protein